MINPGDAFFDEEGLLFCREYSQRILSPANMARFRDKSTVEPVHKLDLYTSSCDISGLSVRFEQAGE